MGDSQSQTTSTTIFLEEVKAIIQSELSLDNKVDILCDLVIPNTMDIPFHQVSNIEEVVVSFRSTCPTFHKSHFQLGVLVSILYFRRSEFKKTIDYLLLLNEKAHKDILPIYRAASYTIMGICSRSLGKSDLAMSNFQYALEVYNDPPFHEYQKFLFRMCIYHIGEIYGELKDYKEMLSKHFLLLELNKEWGNTEFENRGLNGIGRAFQGQGLYATALKYLKLAEESANKRSNAAFKSRNYHDLGNAYYFNGDYALSLAYYEKALELRRKHQLTSAEVTSLIAISDIYIVQRDFNKAIVFLTTALEIAEPLKVNKKIYQIYQKLSTVYEEKRNFEMALKFHKKYHDLKSEVDNVDKTKVENQKVREINTELRQQKKLIETQKQQIEITYAKLQENVKYLENFAAVAAHDLKAPIRIATSFAGLFARKYKDKLDQEDQDYIYYITNNISRLSKMIDDLLLLSKLDQNLPTTEIVDLNHIVNEVEARLSHKLSDAQGSLQVLNELPKIPAHPSLISQLFQNIIDNGIKYAHPERVPLIRISSKASTPFNGEEYCQISIQDNGIGISEEFQSRIFELFSRTSRKDSSGIGLATCKKIINHYGGKLHVQSAVGIGTTFEFTLPIENK